VFARHGSQHDVYHHAERGSLAVPRHRELTIGTARSIARKAGWIERRET
jgi:predicted RNA binding protein YcfA (HicA-like mRNA interferase family)